MALTKQTIIDLSKKLISLKNRKIDLSTGTVLSDLGIDAQAQILASISSDIERIRLQQSFNSQYFTDYEADLLVQSFGLVRKKATKATGNVTFASNYLPSEGSPIIIPLGTTVYGSSGDSSSRVSFVTTSSGSITSSSALNSQTGYYETTVTVEAVSAGSLSNLGIGYINSMNTSISGVSAVYNKDAIVNGVDVEDTNSLLKRFLITWRGRNRNTEPGILAWTYTNPKVQEAVVIGPNSEFSLRGPGAIDVYIRGSYPSQYTQTVTNMSKEVYFTLQPIINPENIVVTIGGVAYYESDNYFKFVKDNRTIFQNSSSARDKLVWTEEGFKLIENQQSYTITYMYDSLVNELQSMYDGDERLITGDVLSRSTTQTNIVMEFGIVVKTGYDVSSTITLIKTNIQNYVNTLPLNTPVRESDIIAIIEGTDGVSYTKLPFLQFHKVGEEDDNKWVEDIESSPLEYFRVNSDDIIVG